MDQDLLLSSGIVEVLSMFIPAVLVDHHKIYSHVLRKGAKLEKKKPVV